MLWDGEHLIGIEEFWAPVITGKCDVCHYFHVWCWDCGEKFALSPKGKHRCYCERRWVSMPVSEEMGAVGAEPDALHLLLIVGDATCMLDRRPLR